MEEWINLEGSGFPEYAIGNFGNVRNEYSGRILRPSSNQSGVYKIGLFHREESRQCTLAIALLVANAFLTPPQNRRFNTPINVDGDRSNNRADNLMWRPRWFATKYHQQFHNDLRGFDIPVVELHSGEKFETSWDAAIKFGLLDREIAIATLNRTYVFPTGQEFRVIR